MGFMGDFTLSEHYKSLSDVVFQNSKHVSSVVDATAGSIRFEMHSVRTSAPPFPALGSTSSRADVIDLNRPPQSIMPGKMKLDYRQGPSSSTSKREILKPEIKPHSWAALSPHPCVVSTEKEGPLPLLSSDHWHSMITKLLVAEKMATEETPPGVHRYPLNCPYSQVQQAQAVPIPNSTIWQKTMPGSGSNSASHGQQAPISVTQSQPWAQSLQLAAQLSSTLLPGSFPSPYQSQEYANSVALKQEQALARLFGANRAAFSVRFPSNTQKLEQMPMPSGSLAAPTDRGPLTNQFMVDISMPACLKPPGTSHVSNCPLVCEAAVERSRKRTLQHDNEVSPAWSDPIIVESTNEERLLSTQRPIPRNYSLQHPASGTTCEASQPVTMKGSMGRQKKAARRASPGRPELEPTSQSFPHACTQSGEDFVSRNALQAHHNIHAAAKADQSMQQGTSMNHPLELVVETPSDVLPDRVVQEPLHKETKDGLLDLVQQLGMKPALAAEASKNGKTSVASWQLLQELPLLMTGDARSSGSKRNKLVIEENAGSLDLSLHL